MALLRATSSASCFFCPLLGAETDAADFGGETLFGGVGAGAGGFGTVTVGLGGTATAFGDAGEVGVVLGGATDSTGATYLVARGTAPFPLRNLAAFSSNSKSGLEADVVVEGVAATFGGGAVVDGSG